MELLRIGMTSALIAAWYAAVLTLVVCTTGAWEGGGAAPQRVDPTAFAPGPSVQSGFPFEQFLEGQLNLAKGYGMDK